MTEANSKPSVVIAPPDAPPRTYVLIKHTQKCKCGCLHEFSELYSEHLLPSNWNKSHVRNLRPHPRIEYSLPIEIISKQIEELPFCHECVMSQSLAHLPPAPQQDARILRLSIDGQPLAPAEPSKAKPPSKRAPATLDDIFGSLGK